MSPSLYHSRPLVLLGVLGFWALSLIEMTPQTFEAHKHVDNLIDPVLESTSLWQGNWDLFAPVIDHWNTRLECEISWEDGSQTRWSTLDWTTASNWQRMRNFRRNEYFENMITSRGHLLYPALSDHIIRTASKNEQKNVRWADMIYLGETLLPPDEHWRKAYTTPQFRDPERFYSWYPHAIPESEIMLFGN
ncbi:MAG: hypothetical protein P8M30_05105 [Planctomycetaceae bacterium]|jgi:hypothetical protein|nr:hypothetical protein [Planctomycetaceae bacterium]MDC0273268.1 hypothetical protein [Planctomycetaceae bacterium]MDG2388680.1 hypothetical protein [Planctomycetaceae bacterium]